MSSAQELTKGPGIAGRFNRKQKMILAGMGLFALSMYLVLGALLLKRGTSDASAVQFAQQGRALALDTARQQAVALATTWQPDAQLVGVSTSWQLASGDQLTLHRATWAFKFYSPAARRLRMVTVGPEGALAPREVPVQTAPAPVEADWGLDSDDLLLTFIASGGEQFIKQHALASIHFQLKRTDAGQSIWYMAAIDPVTRDSHSVSVDALSRQIVVQS